MYTEDFDGLEEAEKESRHTYVSSISDQEAERLIRENERLKKALEKEKFFNKLLDQEIQDLKANNPAGQRPYNSDYWSGNRRVSKGAFYTLLIIAVGMAAYIGYGIYYDNQSNYSGLKKSTFGFPDDKPGAAAKEATSAKTGVTNSQVQPKNTDLNSTQPEARQNLTTEPHANATVKDSVPNIIGTKKASSAKEKPAAVSEQTSALDESEPEAATIGNNSSAEAVDTRAVIARYKVTSKANFYNSPDENSMRSTFIAESPDKIVSALEEKNGFIFVAYTNDLGYTSRGWLSKKDLSKAE